MHRLLFIETSTALCSTALAEDGRIISTRRSSEPRAHASLTAVYVKEMLDEAGWKVSDLDAVCLTVACAPLPAFLFALRRLPRGKPVRRGSARRFLAVVLRAACPYALSAAASFALA